MSVTVEGMDGLLKAIEQVQGDTTDALTKACRLVGMKVAEDAKAIVSIRTGRLANSYHAERPEIDADGAVSVKVSSNVEYAPYIEFGTGYMGANDPYNAEYPVDGLAFTSKETWRYKDEDGNWHTGHPIPAQAPLRRALARQEVAVAETVRQVLEGEIR